MSPENTVRLELLKTAPLNKWVALSEDETKIVAIGNTYSEVADKSDRAGVPDAIIMKTPEQWVPLSI